MRRFLRHCCASSILLLVSTSIAMAAPRLVLSTSAIGPFYINPGTNGTAQTVEASNAGDGSLNLALSSSAQWLTATVGVQRACTAQAGNCLPITISLNTASLTNGNYTEYITVTAPNAVDSPQQISVNVVVASVPASVTLYVAPNGGTQTVNVYPHSPVVGVVATQSGGNWLSFGTPSGVTFGTPYPITGTSQPGQAPGQYSGTVTITGSTFQADNQTVGVTLNVTTSPIIQLNNQTIVLNGSTGEPKVTNTITFPNLGQGTLNISGATVTSTAGSVFSASVVSGNSITLTADPAQASPGLYTATITLASNAANNALVSIPVEFTVAAFGVPNIYQGGIVNISTFAADALAPGDIAAVFGDEFTPQATATFTNPGDPPLATVLGGMLVLVNGVAAPLYYASRQQINFQVPYEAISGQLSTVQVVFNGVCTGPPFPCPPQTPQGNTRSISIVPAAPKILVWPQSLVAGNYGVVVNADNSLVLLPGAGLGASRVPKPGEVIVIYAVGLGQTTPPAQTGAAASSKPIMAVPTPVTVTFGNSITQVQAQAVFAGLTPTLVGLYQVNVTIPANAPTGNSVPLTLSMGGVNANVANIPIASN